MARRVRNRACPGSPGSYLGILCAPFLSRENVRCSGRRARSDACPHHDDPMVDAEDAADLLEAREADLDYIDQFIDPYDYDDNPYA